MKSPLFSERFESDNWSIIFFDVLYNNWDNNKTNIQIDELFNKPTTISKTNSKNPNQINVFN